MQILMQIFMKELILFYWSISILANALLLWASWAKFMKWKQKSLENLMLVEAALMIAPLRAGIKRPKVIIAVALFYVLLSPFLLPINLVIEILSIEIIILHSIQKLQLILKLLLIN